MQLDYITNRDYSHCVYVILYTKRSHKSVSFVPRSVFDLESAGLMNLQRRQDDFLRYQLRCVNTKQLSSQCCTILMCSVLGAACAQMHITNTAPRGARKSVTPSTRVPGDTIYAHTVLDHSMWRQLRYTHTPSSAEVMRDNEYSCSLSVFVIHTLQALAGRASTGSSFSQKRGTQWV